MAPDSGSGTVAPTLADLIASPNTVPDRQGEGRNPTIYARRPWTPDSEAALLYGEWHVEAVTAPGFTYRLEGGLANDVIEVWSAWRNGAHRRSPRRSAPSYGTPSTTRANFTTTTPTTP